MREELIKHVLNKARLAGILRPAHENNFGVSRNRLFDLINCLLPALVGCKCLSCIFTPLNGFDLRESDCARAVVNVSDPHLHCFRLTASHSHRWICLSNNSSNNLNCPLLHGQIKLTIEHNLSFDIESRVFKNGL